MPTLIVAADFVREPSADDYAPRRRRARRGRRAGRDVRRAARARVSEVVAVLRLPGHGAGPDRPVRRRQRGRLPRRVPLLHRAEQVRGPGLPVPRQPGLGAGLRPERHPARAGRRRRPDPARRGRLPARADLDHLGRIGYDGYVSLEVLNPQLWQVPADRVADLGYQALCRVLGRWNRHPPETWGGS